MSGHGHQRGDGSPPPGQSSATSIFSLLSDIETSGFIAIFCLAIPLSGACRSVLHTAVGLHVAYTIGLYCTGTTILHLEYVLKLYVHKFNVCVRL